MTVSAPLIFVYRLSGWVAGYIMRSGFRLPPDPSLPVVMVAGGVGIAPFRAFIQHRHAQRTTHPTAHYGPMELYYASALHDEYAYPDLLQSVRPTRTQVCEPRH